MAAPSTTSTPAELGPGGAVAVPLQEAEDEMKRDSTNGLDGVDDDDDYLSTHSHPRAHPHEKEPEGRVLHALYALEGGDPDSEVDVVHEPPGAKVRGWV